MEVFIGALGAGAASGTAAAAGGTAAAATAGGLSLSGGLSLATGLFSGLATIAQGLQAGAVAESQAAFEEFSARQELLRGREEALRSVEQLNKDLAASVVAGFASGLQPSGSVHAAQVAAIKDGNYQINLERDNAEIAAGGRRLSARQLRAEASAKRFSGVVGGATRIGSTFADFAKTG